MSERADALLDLWREEHTAPQTSLLSRCLRAELLARAEAAGGELRLDLCGGVQIGVVTDEHRERHRAEAAAALKERQAASRARRRQRRQHTNGGR